MDEKRKHVETFFFTNTNYRKTLGQLYRKTMEKWKLNLTASSFFFQPHLCVLRVCVAEEGYKAEGNTEQG